MKTIRILVWISSLLGIFISCHKYPNDPFLSLHTVKSRMINDWRIQTILLNGDDVTQLYNDSLMDYDFTSSRFSINRDPDERKVLEAFFFIEGSRYFGQGLISKTTKDLLNFINFQPEAGQEFILIQATLKFLTEYLVQKYSKF